MSKIRTVIDFREYKIPLDVYIEKRKGWRVSITQKKAIIRIPKGTSKKVQNEYYKKALDWFYETIDARPKLLSKFKLTDYSTRIITVMNVEYTYNITEINNDRSEIRLIGKTLYVRLSKNLHVLEKDETIKKLSSKLFSQRYINKIELEVESINKKYFNKVIQNVRLKYNKSNWGSCSSKLNVNLSTRLLLVPKIVREYVIIHELSHLIEMNHSTAFWNIVKAICPRYKEHEDWLRSNSSEIDF